MTTPKSGQQKRLTVSAVVLNLLMPGFALADQQNPAPTSPTDTAGILAVSSDTFLSSLGVNTHVDQGYNAGSYVLPLRYLGVRNIRDSQRHLASTIMVHQQTGIRVDLLGFDVTTVLEAARTLAKADALLSVEGPNEPNNFPITYDGKRGGGTNTSWVPVALLQKDLYSAAKSDPELKRFPIFHVSEGGAEVDNVGLQYLTIPEGANTLLPDGTQFADYANVHNYVTGVRMGHVDNQAWQAADPTLNSGWDSLYKGYGKTWLQGFRGYSNQQLETLPRVTTETGWDAATPDEERVQGTILVNNYLAQFKRGWRYTFIYELGEGEGGGGHQGLFHENWTPKLAATYIHNLTTILADDTPLANPGRLQYHINNQPSTVHDLLLQKSSGPFELVVWGEQVAGEKKIAVNFESAHRITIFDTTAGITPIQVLTNTATVPLTMSDHALILQIE